MKSNDEQLYSVVQSAIEIASPSKRKELLDKSCAGRPGLRTRLQAIVDALPEDAPHKNNPVRRSEDSVLWSLTPERPPSVVLDDSPLEEPEPVIQPASVEIPKTIESSRFQLQGEIARGGMGAVLQGRDVDLGRNLAIKVLLDQHKHKPHVIQRFIEEAQIGGQLQHPGIAPVYELGQFEDGRPFFTMKLVKGDTLAYLLANRKSLDQERSKLLGIFEQVCQTIAYAHNRRVIHRDLKPANVMVGAFGEVQVMDWGLAKVLPEAGPTVPRDSKPKVADGKSVIATLRSGGIDAPEAIGSAGSTPSETQMGSALGTPAYMPPEQALGEVDQMDRRSDVFGLGAILCEILTGKPPYIAEDTAALMRLVTRGNTTECFVRLDESGADQQLVQLAKDCLAYEWKNRPTSAEEVSNRVAAYLESVEQQLKETEIRRAEEEAKTVEERKRLRVTLALTASVLLTLAIGGGGWVWNQQQFVQRRQAANQEFNVAVNQAKLHRKRAENSDLIHRQEELELALQNAKAALSVTANRDLSDEILAVGRELEAQLASDLDATINELAVQRRTERLRQQFELIRASGGDDPGNRVNVGVTGPSWNFDATNKQYKKTFADAGIDFDNQTDQQLYDAIRHSPIRETLVVAIDHWIRSVPEVSDKSIVKASLSIGDWQSAAEVAGRALEEDASQLNLWLNRAAALSLMGADKEYIKLRQQMGQEFLATKVPRQSLYTTMVYVLRPIKFDLSLVPSSPFERALDEGRLDNVHKQLGWETRALLELRRNNLEQAVRCLGNARLNQTDKDASVIRLGIRALLENASGDRGRSLQTLDELRQMIGLRLDHPSRRNSDATFISLVLLREVESVLENSDSASRIPRFLSGQEIGDEIPEPLKRKRLRKKLYRLAQQTDSCDWRKQVRRAVAENDSELLKHLASDEKSEGQPAEIIAALGAMLREAGELEGALILLRRSHLRYPADFWLNYELAKCYRARGNAIESLNYARTAYAVSPKSPAAQFLMVTSLSDSDFVSEAGDLLKRMLADSNAAPSELVRLGSRLSIYGRHQLAEILIRKSIELAPQEGFGYQMLSRTLAMSGRIDAAVDAARKGVEFSSSDPLAHAILGASLSDQGQPDQAIKAFRQAIQLKPSNPWLHVALAQQFLVVGKTGDAESALRTALEIDPSNQQARQTLAKLRETDLWTERLNTH